MQLRAMPEHGEGPEPRGTARGLLGMARGYSAAGATTAAAVGAHGHHPLPSAGDLGHDYRTQSHGMQSLGT